MPRTQRAPFHDATDQRRVRLTGCLLLAATVSVAGCSKGVSSSAAPPAVRSVTDVEVASPTSLAAQVNGASATVKWSPPTPLPQVTGYVVYLDEREPVQITPDKLLMTFKGLSPGSEHLVQVVALTAAGQSRPASVAFAMPYAASQDGSDSVDQAVPAQQAAKQQVPVAEPGSDSGPATTSTAARQSSAEPATAVAPKAAQPVAPVAASPIPERRPRGNAELVSYRRLPNSQQDRYGCDRLVVTIANRSDTPISDVTVTFGTTWYGEAMPPPPSQPGREVTIERSAGIGAYGEAALSFDVCLPEKQTSNVFAAPRSLEWTWVPASG